MDNAWEDDFMERKPSADFLTSYILSNAHIKVLNVNSPWGTGKSFFLERWAKMLSDDHVCVRFNAWETDYSAEPLVALIACIEEQLTDPSELSSTKVGAAVINTGSTLIKKAGPLILKGLVRKFSGVELDDLLAKGAEDAVDSVVEGLIRDQVETRNSVKEFKTEVTARLSQAANDRALKSPAFIFIDELDRCRPTYAIELLERIKHFFELEDCRFVIASDSTQLAHSIRAVYGQGFASERYLNRFFDAEFRLDNDDIFTLVKNILPEIDSLLLGINISADLRAINPYARARSADLKYANRDTVKCELKGYTENQLIFVGLAKCFDVGLRELTSYVKQIDSAASTLGGKVSFLWLAFLVFYKNSKAEQYLNFFSTKGPEELKALYGARVLGINFHFNTSLESIFDIVSFYHALVTADEEGVRHMAQNVAGWRSHVYHDNMHGDVSGRLRNYRKVVDLAYRLN